MSDFYWGLATEYLPNIQSTASKEFLGDNWRTTVCCGTNKLKVYCEAICSGGHLPRRAVHRTLTLGRWRALSPLGADRARFR